MPATRLCERVSRSYLRQGQRPPHLGLGRVPGGRGDHPLRRRADRLRETQERVKGGRGAFLRPGALPRRFQAEHHVARGRRRELHKRRVREWSAQDHRPRSRPGASRSGASSDTSWRLVRAGRFWHTARRVGPRSTGSDIQASGRQEAIRPPVWAGQAAGVEATPATWMSGNEKGSMKLCG